MVFSILLHAQIEESGSQPLNITFFSSIIQKGKSVGYYYCNIIRTAVLIQIVFWDSLSLFSFMRINVVMI